MTSKLMCLGNLRLQTGTWTLIYDIKQKITTARTLGHRAQTLPKTQICKTNSNNS